MPQTMNHRRGWEWKVLGGGQTRLSWTAEIAIAVAVVTLIVFLGRLGLWP